MNPPNLSHRPCGCNRHHARRRVVLTGGPGAGKTALLELVRQSFCPHVSVLPEAASIVFGGGFPRGDGVSLRQAEQRAIFYVQRELEAVADGGDAAVVLCDRCTVDGGAYWPGPGDLWSSVGTTLAEQLARYDTVIHLRTPADGHGYDHRNPLRVESAVEAARIDERIARLWEGHPRRFTIEAADDFLAKASRGLEILRGEVPECCRRQDVPAAMVTAATALDSSLTPQSSNRARDKGESRCRYTPSSFTCRSPCRC